MIDLPSSVIAVIPARGGSKGISNKNLQLIAGVSLIGRCVKTALNCSALDYVFVSTDDPLIALEANKYGAQVITRPPQLASDVASSESALLHALSSIKSQGLSPSKIVFLQCTSPFTTCSDIEKVLNALHPPVVNSSFAAIPWHGFLWSEEGLGVNHSPEEPRKRRQDLPEVFLETGAIYAMQVDAFEDCRSRFCQPCQPVSIDSFGFEIDTQQDLDLCRKIIQSS